MEGFEQVTGISKDGVDVPSLSDLDRSPGFYKMTVHCGKLTYKAEVTVKNV
jgi:hypothetical protein